MTINLYLLNDQVRYNLARIGYDHYADEVATNDLKAAYDHIVMLSDYAGVDLVDVRESSLTRCIINLATYYGYRSYTRLAERQDATIPETASLHVVYDEKIAKACLELLLGIKLDESLSPLQSSPYKPCNVDLGYSLLDYDSYE